MYKIIPTILLTLILSATLLFSQTLVTVNGHKITDAIIPKGYQELDDTKKSNLIEHLIKEELLHAYLLKQNLVHSEEFKKAFEQQKQLASEQYKKATGKALNKEQIRNLKGSIALALYQKQLFESTTVSDSEIKNFYDTNQEKFNFPNSIEIANIITKTEDEAKKIIKKLQSASNLEEAFVQTAKEHKQNGYMGWFGEGMAPQNLFDAAYKAPAKTLLKKPIKTKHGYHVIYLLNKKAAGKLSYDEAKASISRMMRQQKVMQTIKDKVDELYGKAEIIY